MSKVLDPTFPFILQLSWQYFRPGVSTICWWFLIFFSYTFGSHKQGPASYVPFQFGAFRKHFHRISNDLCYTWEPVSKVLDFTISSISKLLGHISRPVLSAKLVGDGLFCFTALPDPIRQGLGSYAPFQFAICRTNCQTAGFSDLLLNFKWFVNILGTPCVRSWLLQSFLLENL